MKVTAKPVPYSSIVGGGITLHASTGEVMGQIAFFGGSPKHSFNTGDTHVKLAENLSKLINDAGGVEI
jgi:hypothetical protein